MSSFFSGLRKTQLPFPPFQINDLLGMLNMLDQKRIQDQAEEESQLTEEDLEKMERRKRREEDRKKKLKGIIFNEVQKIEKRLEVLEEPIDAGAAKGTTQVPGQPQSAVAPTSAPNAKDQPSISPSSSSDTVVSTASVSSSTDSWAPIIKSEGLQADVLPFRLFAKRSLNQLDLLFLLSCRTSGRRGAACSLKRSTASGWSRQDRSISL